MAVPRFILEMKRRRHREDHIQRMVFDNPVQFLGQSANFKIEQKPRLRETHAALELLARADSLQIDPRDSFHLTYCTNIHPGEDWATVEATIREVGPEL